MAIDMKMEVAKTVDAVLLSGAHLGTRYIDDKLVVRATRKLQHGRIPGKQYNVEMNLTIGRPNFSERKFIKDCKKSGESFPVKKIQLKFPSKKKAN